MLDLRHFHAHVIFLYAALVLVSACDGDPRCVPGRQEACVCSDGRVGQQTCSASGTYDACTCARSPAPTAGSPVSPTGVAAPTADPSSWVALVRPWTRLFYNGDVRTWTTERSLDWRAADGVVVTISAAIVDTYTEPENPEDWREGVQEATLTLYGEWEGGGARRALLHFQSGAVGPSVAEWRASVAYAGIRHDGLLLVSLEVLPQGEHGGGGSELRGECRRALVGWDRAQRAPLVLAQWEGPTANVPSRFRIRAPRE